MKPVYVETYDNGNYLVFMHSNEEDAADNARVNREEYGYPAWVQYRPAYGWTSVVDIYEYLIEMRQEAYDAAPGTYHFKTRSFRTKRLYPTGVVLPPDVEADHLERKRKLMENNHA